MPALVVDYDMVGMMGSCAETSEPIKVGGLLESGDREKEPSTNETVKFELKDKSDEVIRSNGEVKQQLIGINGNWYDITKFIDKHPGGPIIKQFLNKDATTAFHAFGHPEYVLKHRKPIDTYKREVDPVTAHFEDMIDGFKKRGFYKTDWWFYLQRLCLGFGIMSMSFLLLLWTNAWWWVHAIAAPIILMTAGQQFGYVMHETMHKQLIRRGMNHRYFGALVGTALTGFSSAWWHMEHNEHHAATNVVDFQTKFVDPQMIEECWVQDEIMFPLYTPPKSKIQRALLRFQHLTYIPFVLFFSRAQIIFDSLRDEKKWWELLAAAVYFIWISCFFSLMPTWPRCLVAIFVYNALGGYVHFLFTLSHYCRMFHDGEDWRNKSWYQAQIESNMNLDIWPWMTWWYGGLNFHIEHHLFPTIARNKMYLANIEVRAACQKFGIDYQSVTLPEAFRRTVAHLKVISDKYGVMLDELERQEKKKVK